MSAECMERIVKTMISQHDALCKLADRKCEAIKNGDAQTVSAITKEEAPFVDELSRLEKKRIAAIQSDLGGARSEATFSEWEQAIIPEDEQEKWQHLYLDLAKSVYTLKQANTLNQELLRDSLLWVKLNIGLLKPKTRTLNNYQNPRGGQSPSSVFSGRIDSRT
ncbi:flagellar protein FlgN [Sporolactobacillus sp. STSJ-5]|uniref:flagellar protein FlgN n=1 Tax=Sporolactobacillus sp. STSJ-5 TaxID=2965076 RepID=UPI0021051319|nr:flagellar protein FlgN [Sporolactobacillus sp. STSJ-5]MCQ2009664.1 flagellar protein FlgN [Sporolactobacillus sp. STSJ-5]